MFSGFNMQPDIFSGCTKKQSLPVSPAPAQEQVSQPDQGKNVPETPGKDTAAEIEEAAIEQPKPVQQVTILQDLIQDIHFDFDSSAIRSDAREILQANAALLMKNKFSSITIEGHCDERGTSEYNLALGQRRADETKRYLTNLGIKESLIQTVSYGEERPLDPAHNEEAWAKTDALILLCSRKPYRM